MAIVSAAAPAPALAGQARTASHPLLDVPYVSQTPELCGGAALAMVLRYWGERQVFPEDFEPLIVASERGIPTGSLVSAVRDRNWQAVVVPPDALDPRAQIRDAVDRGRPLIALIEVGPRTYHYVVIVGATDEEIVVHDPARAPFRVLRWDGFDRVWAAAGQWMMLVLPPEGARSGASAAPVENPAPGVAATAAPTACDALVEHGVSLGLSGDRDGAEAGLVAATRVCPLNAAGWVELAGLRFSESQWADAAVLAQTAVRLAPADAHAREILATSRYLSGDVTGALDAWTPVGAPRIDTVSIVGAERTRHPVVAAAAGLQPRQLLTSEAFRRAVHRVQALPVASSARMHYAPLEGGLAAVDVLLAERGPYPKGWVAFTILGARAAAGHELRVDLAGLLGSGERMSVSGRWQAERPRVALGLAFPSPPWLTGVLSFDAMWERQSYPNLRESRRRMALQLSNWSTSWLHWKARAALDRFDGRRYVSVEGGLDLRLARDRVALVASGVAWSPTSGGRRFNTRSGLGAWRSTDDTTRGVWSAAGDVSLASSGAPRAVWEGAGTGSGRAGLLRAHPLLDGGVLTGPAFGRGLATGKIEYARPVGRTLAGVLSFAAFIDAAQAWHRPGGLARSPLYVDAGVGVRVRLPSREAIRIDIAHGLRGGGVTLSIGILGVWPG